MGEASGLKFLPGLCLGGGVNLFMGHSMSNQPMPKKLMSPNFFKF